MRLRNKKFEWNRPGRVTSPTQAQLRDISKETGKKNRMEKDEGDDEQKQRSFTTIAVNYSWCP